MRTTLVNPPTNAGETMNVNVKNTRLTPHIGLMYLSSCLKNAGHRVRIIDSAARNHSNSDTLEKIKNTNPEIIGLTATTVSYRNAKKIIGLVKNELGEIPIVIGGYQATILPEFVMKDCKADYLVFGEGEKTFVQLTEALENGKNIEKIKGIYYRDNGRVIQTRLRDFLDLDKLPFPDWEVIENTNDYGHLGSVISIAKGEQFGVVIASRGCPYSCTFCAASRLYNYNFRARDIEKVIEEISWHLSEGRRHIYLQDDNFTVIPKRVEEFCKHIKKEKLDFEWYCLCRVDAKTELYPLMAKANCKIVYYGLESGSQKVLNYFNKKTTPQQAISALKKAHEADLLTIGSFIIGSPLETARDLYQSLKVAIEGQLDIMEPNVLTLFPGTELWEEYNHQKELPLDRQTSIESFVNFNVMKRVEWFFKQFYGRKTNLIRVFFKVLKNNPRLIFHNLPNLLATLKYISHSDDGLCESYPKRSDY